MTRSHGGAVVIRSGWAAVQIGAGAPAGSPTVPVVGRFLRPAAVPADENVCLGQFVGLQCVDRNPNAFSEFGEAEVPDRRHSEHSKPLTIPICVGNVVGMDAPAPITEQDPPRSRFDGYAVPTPEGAWKYALDDFGIAYRRTGWPFAPAEPTRGRDGNPITVRSIRLAPDTAYQSWRNEYVMLSPGRSDTFDSAGTGPWAHAWLKLWVRPQGMGGIVVPTTIDINWQTETVDIDPDCPPALRDQATLKGHRILEFLAEHQRLARTRGQRTPVTAHSTWLHRRGA